MRKHRLPFLEQVKSIPELTKMQTNHQNSTAEIRYLAIDAVSSRVDLAHCA
jgi:hypothetical protein